MVQTGSFFFFGFASSDRPSCFLLFAEVVARKRPESDSLLQLQIVLLGNLLQHFIVASSCSCQDRPSKKRAWGLGRTSCTIFSPHGHSYVNKVKTRKQRLEKHILAATKWKGLKFGCAAWTLFPPINLSVICVQVPTQR